MIVATALNLTRATFQDIFDYVVLALIQQGEPSSAPDGRCLYRSGDGLRCAAGHLISDAEYTARNREPGGFGEINDLERKTVEAVIEHGYAVGLEAWVESAPIPASDDSKPASDSYENRLGFLRGLQRAHDVPVVESMEGDPDAKTEPAEWLAQFRVRARKVANEYGLDAFMVGYRSGF